MSKQSFAELGVSHAVCDALARRGIKAPFPVQRLVLEDALAGRDVLVKSPTGLGQDPRVRHPAWPSASTRSDPTPAALVLAPTRELARQILEELEGLAAAKGLRAAAVYGGVGLGPQAKQAARAHVLVATPGRLEDLLGRRAFTLDQIRILVLDEADRMLDMGFRPAIDRIVAACSSERQTMFFSATLDGIAGDLAGRYTAASEDARARQHRDGTTQAASRAPLRARRATETAWRRSSRNWTGSGTGRSCSCAPSAARIALSSGSTPAA